MKQVHNIKVSFEKQVAQTAELCYNAHVIRKQYTTNKSIIERAPSKSPSIRDQLHHLKVGEYITTNDPEAVRTANSLSRATKKHSGTKFSVRSTTNGKWEIQLVPHRIVNQQLMLPMPEAKVDILPPPPPKSIKMHLDDSDVKELYALRDLFNGFMQRLEHKWIK